MSQEGKGKKMVSLAKKKDLANAARETINREAQDFNSTMTRMEEDQISSGYTPQKKSTMDKKMKTVMNKLLGKGKSKKRTAQSPIVGAALKFHKDGDPDDVVDPAADAVVVA